MKYSGYCIVVFLGLFFLHTHTVSATTFTVPTNGMQAYTQQFFATVEESSPRIIFEWPAYTNGLTNLTYQLYRKTATSTSWGSSISGTLSSTTLTWVDTNVEEGSAYEYQLQGAGYGYLYSGFKIPTTFSRGRVILLVESSVAIPLASEIERLTYDLIGDGWQVVQLNVASSSSVVSVKSQIVSEYNNDPSNTRALFIIGHVPVPYSGYLALDGHYPQHEGAWATDAFYADLNGTWTDTTVNKTVASYTRNYNVPGDGKYDQFYLPSSPELAVGRVDLYNMPAFGLSEVELLRRYLDKDHEYRQRSINPRRVALMGDNFGTYVYNSQTAWNNMTGLMGPTSIDNKGSSFFTYVASSTYLMTFGSGGGTFTSASGVGTTAQYAASTTYGVFNSLFGSYFGDWDNQNNLLKAPIAGAGYGLTNMWGGWPAYHLHRMALGGTIGESIVETQKNGVSCCYSPLRVGYNSIVVNLMGDPTLRMYMVSPPSNVQSDVLPGGSVDISWTASSDDVLGYYVLRSTSALGPYELATTSRIDSTSYSESLTNGTYYYMVRAEKLEETPSGSFYNKSQGAFAPSSATVINDAPTVDAGQDQSIALLGDPIVLNGLVSDDGGIDGLTISWSVISGPNESYVTSFTATTSTSTSVTVSTIGNYVFRLTASDGASVSYDDVSISVDDQYDMAGPNTPTGLSATVMSDTEIRLEWPAVSDVGSGGGTATGMGGYVLYRDDVPLSTTTQLQFDDTGLSQNTEYTYSVVAFDNNGNVSSSSETVFATTQYTPTNPTVTTGEVSEISTSSVLLFGSLDDTGHISVTEIGFIYSTSTNSTSTIDRYISELGDASVGSFSQTLTGLVCGTTYYYSAFAFNEVGYGYGIQSSFDTSACPSPVVDGGNSGGSGGGSGGSRSSSGGGSRTPTVTATVASSTATSTPFMPTQPIACPVGYVCTPVAPATISTAQPGAYTIAETTLYRNLTVGAVGTDVMSLQQFLNAQGYTVASTGPGSPGNETAYFGSLTRTALARFQAAHNISPSVGYFGPITRAYILTYWR